MPKISLTQIKHEGVSYYLGSFVSREVARATYLSAKGEYKHVS